MSNIFRETKLLLSTRAPGDFIEEERSTMAAALIPFTVGGVPFPEDITLVEGLEILAGIVEEANETAS